MHFIQHVFWDRILNKLAGILFWLALIYLPGIKLAGIVADSAG